MVKEFLDKGFWFLAKDPDWTAMLVAACRVKVAGFELRAASSEAAESFISIFRFKPLSWHRRCF